MKLTVVWLVGICCTVQLLSAAPGYSQGKEQQRISLNYKETSLVALFEAIEKKADVAIMYENTAAFNNHDVSIAARNKTLAEILNQVLQNRSLKWSILGNVIRVEKLQPAPSPSSSSASDTLITISGAVVTEDGTPIPGATIMVKGSTLGCITNAKGAFSLIVRKYDVLVITSIGYQTMEMKVSGPSLTVKMNLALSKLEETVVIAYGSTTRRYATGSIGTVKAADIEKQPVTNPLLALQGQVPGLAVNATSGVPGSRVLVQVRGQNSLSALPGVKPYDQPLFIIDGVPFAPQNNNVNQLITLASTHGYSGGISQAGGISPFNNINPRDIESITVLKDADATSIYGTQGANGVIIITTKKGTAGKTAFDLSMNTGFSVNARSVPLLNTQQYLQLRREAFVADGATPSNDPDDYDNYAPDLTIFDQNKYTDWRKAIFGKTPGNVDVHGSLSGGSANNTFLVSAGYTRAEFNFPGDYADQRFSFHSVIHHGSNDNRFNIDLVSDYGYENNNSPGFSGDQNILMTPNLPDLVDKSGNLVWNYKGVDLQDYQIYAYKKKPTELQNYNLNNSLRFSYNILKGLNISANIGYNRNTTSEHAQNPASAQDPSNASSSASFAESLSQSINIEPQLDYKTTIGNGDLSVLLGGSYKDNTGRSNVMQGYNYANENFLGSINGAASVMVSDNSSIYKYAAGFARINYIYAKKYILNLTGRRDGSSNFGPGRQFGSFGSVAGGWIFSEETGFKNALPFTSFGKLTASYGTSGSDGIQGYLYQAFWNPIKFVPAFQNAKPNTPQNLYNPDYSWALKKSFNVSLDLGFLDDHLLFNATFYRSREGNQLVQNTLPIQAGFTNVLENLNATIQNQGGEFSLSSTNIKTKAFSWSSNFNIAFNRNKLVDFPNLQLSSYSQRYVIGQPTSVIYGFRYKGVNPETGLFEFYTHDGHVTSNPTYGPVANGGDQVPVANREVKYMGGIGNNLSYKNLSLYLFFQFANQNAPNYLYTLYGFAPLGLSTYNQPAAVLGQYWQKPGDKAPLQRLSSNYGSDGIASQGAFISSDGAYSNDTYLRLKTVSLSYSLPVSFTEKLHVQKCSIYANAQNLLTFTNYKVGDPEQYTYLAAPLLRSVAFGLNIIF